MPGASLFVRDVEAMRYRVMLLGLVLPGVLLAQQPEPSMPRFRSGANLVRVDT